jgi:hypothetical protein
MEATNTKRKDEQPDYETEGTQVNSLIKHQLKQNEHQDGCSDPSVQEKKQTIPFDTVSTLLFLALSSLIVSYPLAAAQAARGGIYRRPVHNKSHNSNITGLIMKKPQANITSLIKSNVKIQES